MPLSRRYEVARCRSSPAFRLLCLRSATPPPGSRLPIPEASGLPLRHPFGEPTQEGNFPQEVWPCTYAFRPSKPISPKIGLGIANFKEKVMPLARTAPGYAGAGQSGRVRHTDRQPGWCARSAMLASSAVVRSPEMPRSWFVLAITHGVVAAAYISPSFTVGLIPG